MEMHFEGKLHSDLPTLAPLLDIFLLSKAEKHSLFSRVEGLVLCVYKRLHRFEPNPNNYIMRLLIMRICIYRMHRSILPSELSQVSIT